MHTLIAVTRAVYGAVTSAILGMACKQVFAAGIQTRVHELPFQTEFMVYSMALSPQANYTD
jgi:hypothetical protein